MEHVFKYLIYTHAAFGALALLAGLLAISVKKGGKTHKRSGIIFFYSMLLSAALALIIAFLPGHENLFLFLVGIFSSYFLLSGYRALRFKRKGPGKVDFLISGVMLLAGLFMLLYLPLAFGKINIVLTVFGAVGTLFASRDLYVLSKRKECLKKAWLRKHLGNMMGAYISSVTAFVVVNNLFDSVLNWFLPSLIGTIYIVYWMRKLRLKKIA
jgi:hypothetical protein